MFEKPLFFLAKPAGYLNQQLLSANQFSVMFCVGELGKALMQLFGKDSDGEGRKNHGLGLQVS